MFEFAVTVTGEGDYDFLWNNARELMANSGYLVGDLRVTDESPNRLQGTLEIENGKRLCKLVSIYSNPPGFTMESYNVTVNFHKEQTVMPVNLYYPGGECPDCQEPIPDECEAGDECEGCGHVFKEDYKLDEPDEDDYVTYDHINFYQYGKVVVSVEDGYDWKNAVREHMKTQQFWPSVWAISDHGNSVLLSLQDEHD